MDLSSLEIFLAVAEEGSVTRAAKRLARAPSNVTTRVQLLEEQLEAPLFSRDGKRMTLTAQGQCFIFYAKRIKALAEEAKAALKSVEPPRILRVGTMESTAASRLPPVLTQFNEQNPEVTLRLTLGATRELTKAVVAGDLDCALIATPRGEGDWLASTGINTDDLHAAPVYREDLLLVLPANHSPVAKPEDIRLPALAALEPGCTYRQVAERWIRKGANLPTVEMSSYHAILAHVVAGNAVGVMPRSVLEMLPWSKDSNVHRLGPIDTLLISRRTERSDPLLAFEEIMLASVAPETFIQ
ncbi:LysR family transcriptional regulator (plasmid) [Rhizobium grahamii]|uniref:HTH-type transcriptional regulator TtuA n=1 Tax=Rhizobium grahamii TaxID=1120045 RepID=A0A5Q0CFB1_9HYPH|nr:MULTISPECIES: LysR family transcriptional regulator [Rhizobium]QFY63174.1 LysR family transcriptional regulator [Rhizobium grahamii]QRM52064.1 LysR family transcriptional regulator [Rhizobium sp. BG6]